jgi:hypothetical protein
MVPEREATSMSNQFAVNIPAGFFFPVTHTRKSYLIFLRVITAQVNTFNSKHQEFPQIFSPPNLARKQVEKNPDGIRILKRLRGEIAIALYCSELFKSQFSLHT